MKSLKIVFVVSVSCALQLHGFEASHVDPARGKSDIDVSKTKDTATKNLEKAEKDVLAKADHDAKAQKLTSDALKESDSSSVTQSKGDRSSLKSTSEEKTPLSNATFDLAESLVDQDALQKVQDIHDKKFNTPQDFINYISYKLQQLADMLPSSLPDHVQTQLNSSQKSIKNLNKKLEEARTKIDSLQQKFINSYNPETGTYGYDEGTFQADVKKEIEPVARSVQNIIDEISITLKENNIAFTHSEVQSYLKDFSQDMKSQIEDYKTPEQKKEQVVQNKKSSLSPKFNKKPSTITTENTSARPSGLFS